MTEEEAAQITMLMRMIEFFRTHEIPLTGKEGEEMKEKVMELKMIADNIFEQLTEEEKNELIERYREEMEYLNRMEEEE